MFIGLLIAFFVIILDQIVKFWVIQTLPLHESRDFIPGLLDFFHLRNEGASWGILSGQQMLFILLTVGMLIYLFYQLKHTSSYQKLSQIAYGLLIGGAIGNLIDRIRLGYVVDMFRFLWIDFPIFNVADIALTLGLVIILVTIFWGKDAI